MDNKPTTSQQNVLATTRLLGFVTILTRETWTLWRQCNEGPQKQVRNLSVCHTRKGLKKWDGLAWGRKAQGDFPNVYKYSKDGARLLPMVPSEDMKQWA